MNSDRSPIMRPLWNTQLLGHATIDSSMLPVRLEKGLVVFDLGKHRPSLLFPRATGDDRQARTTRNTP